MKRNLKNTADLYLLDFDGVVLDSADIKTDAFYELYKPYGLGVAKKAKEFHIKNQGVSRFKKFQEIKKLYLNNVTSIEDSEELSSRFSDIILKKILSAPFVEGVLDFLNCLKREEIPTFLLSATPHEELISICKEREIEHFFSGIYGSPEEKYRRGLKIIKKWGVDISRVIFIGDSINDYESAVQLKVQFIGLVLNGKRNPFPPLVKTVNNFNKLKIKQE